MADAELLETLMAGCAWCLQQHRRCTAACAHGGTPQHVWLPLPRPNAQMGGCELKRSMLWQGSMDALRINAAYPAIELPLPTLALHCTSPVPSLAWLLSALQLAGAAPRAFRRLELQGHLPQPHDSAACTQLRQLSELVVKDVQPAAGGTLKLGLAGLLQQAGQLSSLEISTDWGRPGKDAALGAVPACQASYRGLTSLSLNGQELADLPDGEYLTGGCWGWAGGLCCAR